MGEATFRHEIISLNDSLNVAAVNTDSDAHDHMLRALGHASVDTKEVGSLEGFEPEAVIETLTQ